MTSLELCAGAGGQALGIESAGFEHVGLIEVDSFACRTLRHNRPRWAVHEADLNTFDARPYRGVDLVAGGLPCPPFSKAGKQLGDKDERNLFPAALRIIAECEPRAIMIENVRGLLDPAFNEYRLFINSSLQKLGFSARWQLLNAKDFGVPQLRPRVVLVALREDDAWDFMWPAPLAGVQTVGASLVDLMASEGWPLANQWAEAAQHVAPTIVGGSKKHGGPDLGPTRSKKAWEALGVNGKGVADSPPSADFVGLPKLTVRMVARLQGFPDDWSFQGGKTAQYRQVGNAFPPPVATAVARQISQALAPNAVRVGA